MSRLRSFFSFRVDDKGTPIRLGIMVCSLWFLSGVTLFWFKEDRGTIGDMFGAINALFSGLAFAGIIYTILLQREELGQQREELKLTRAEFEKQNQTMRFQRFENSFFQLLSSRREIMQSLRLDSVGIRYEGVGVIVYVNQQLQNSGLGKFDLRTGVTDQVLEQMRGQYFSIVNSPAYSNQIALFLDTLASLLTFIANTDLIDKDGDRFRYFSIVSAQLTIAERTFLFYYLSLDHGSVTYHDVVDIETRFNFVANRKGDLFHPSHIELGNRKWMAHDLYWSNTDGGDDSLPF